MGDSKAEDLRIVAAVSLVQNAINRLEKMTENLKSIGKDWEKFGMMNMADSMEMILIVGGAGIQGEWFMNSINRLNAHLDSVNPYPATVRVLITYCKAAGLRCLRKFSELWDEVIRKSAIEAFRSGSLTSKNALPLQIKDKRNIIEAEGRWAD
jgi:hypothetical protein